ncbi:hypothetical protein K435DRAFT_772120 [Dendrothele bispora CBS 962.96]|uniref:WW domain-containing protein n=1 Tax=Dendrothele bispora (strain CBS 962.96) TaxID=1314807 RepID=A0A4S8MZ46_DENBC|nr:hypothetical protein K435DRAFT_772120 [Dendrothele bispora CBS 962.96]
MFPSETTVFPLPDGWSLHVHPRGWIYFSNKQLKAVVDQDIRQPEHLSTFFSLVSEHGALELNEEMEIHYHFSMSLWVNHKYCIASSERDGVINMTEELYQRIDANTLNRRRRLYWNYLSNHPAHIEKCPDRAVSDASDALTWFYTDNLISAGRSLSPFSKAECEELSKIIADLTHPRHEYSVGKVIFLAWLLREVCSYRDAEAYGMRTLAESRAAHKQRLPKPLSSPRPSRSLLPLVNLIIAFLFFGIPRIYLDHMKASFEYRGRFSVLEKQWRSYVDRLVREYSHFLLISTVLLSATVGFLTVDDLSRGTQVAATISAFSALGSIIVGVFSIWRHQGNMKPSYSWNYMRNTSRNILGLHGHAMLLSLPPVLLVWAIISFTISIIAYMIQHVGDGDVWERIWTWLALVVFALISITVLAALHAFSVIWTFQASESWPLTRSKPTDNLSTKESDTSSV